MSYLPVLLIAMAFGLSACGQGNMNNSVGQVVARVDGREISVRQADKALSSRGDFSEVQDSTAAANALDWIIDQEVLAQKAREAGLDRDLQVMHAIERAKRKILARAYLNRSAGAIAAVSPAEISSFYKENPELFERRRFYRLTELRAAVPLDKFDALRVEVVKAKNMGEIAGWLEARKLPFQAVAASKPAESIPLKILPRLSNMKDGQIAVFATSRGATVMQLLNSSQAPMSEKQAAPLIRQFLFNRTWLEFAQGEVRRLRERARVEYVGEVESERLAMSARFGASRSQGARNYGLHMEQTSLDFNKNATRIQ